ncbi:NADPH oxidase organizer 1a [Menidia menidia]
MESERYPISVSLTGVLHKGKSKMYITSVGWSDQAEIVVYRSFKDFKKMHKELKNVFPSTGKGRKSDRILPKFKDNKGKKKREKAPTKSLVRLKVLQKYCRELLSCDPRVSQCPDLTRFFQPTSQDLDPEYLKSSIKIMLSEEEIRGNGGFVEAGNVTQPFVTEMYRCVAQYETKDTKNKPFKVAVDEKVDVLIKDKAGWWLVENEKKQMAWFPAPYLERLEDDDYEDDDDDELDGTPKRGFLHTAIKTYNATKDDEISVNIGTVVEVLRQSDNGWWYIRHREKEGYIPAMCLQPYSSPQILMASHQVSRSSSPFLFPSAGLQQQSQQSRSQGNLLQLLPVRSPSPSPVPAGRTQRALSLTGLSQVPRAPALESNRAPGQTRVALAVPGQQAPPPAIMVDGEEGFGPMAAGAEDSFESSSFSDELGSLSDESSLNLAFGAAEERLRLSRTPPPTGAAAHLSPAAAAEGRLLPSVSDPSLFQRPSSPRVPPRPQAQDILTRCSTVTRKNVAKGSASPTQTEITGR